MKIFRSYILVLMLAGGVFFPSVPAAKGQDTTGVSNFLKELQKKKFTNPDSVLQLTDSVIGVLNKYGASKQLIDAYRLKGYVYIIKQNRSNDAVETYKTALKLSKQIGDTTRMVHALLGIATVFSNIGESDSAARYFQYCFSYEDHIKNEDLKNTVRMNMALLLIKQSFHDSAARMLFKAEPYYKKVKNHFRLGLLYNYLGALYQDMELYSDAKNFYLLSLKELGQTSDNKNISVQVLGNLAYMYESMGLLDSAGYYYGISLEMTDKKAQPRFYYFQKLNLANLYLKTNRFDKAIKIYKEIYTSPFFKLNKRLQTALYTDFAYVYLKTGKPDSASFFNDTAKFMAVKYNLPGYLNEVYLNAFRIDSIKGNYLKAISWLQKAHHLSDSLDDVNDLEHIKKLSLAHSLKQEKKLNEALSRENDLKNERIKRRTELLIIEGILLVSVLILLIQITLSRKKIKKLHAILKLKNEQLKRQTALLEKENRLKTKFFSIISHDLRSPFNTMLGITELLQSPDYDFDEKEIKELISALSLSIQGAYELLENLLEWSRLQLGKINPVFEQVDITKVIFQSCDLYRLTAKSKKIDLICNLPEGIMGYADKYLISGLLNNLINNAVKFTPESGRVEITSEESDDFVRICVSDTGIGIPEEKLKTLFDTGNNFVRYGTAKEKGTGLGLNLCNEYAHLLGGTLTVESTEGKGSRFCFTIPKTANRKV